jgi:hypothetical protein
MSAPGPNASYADKIQWLLEGHEELLKAASQQPEPTTKLEQDVAKVQLDESDKKEVSIEQQARRAFFDLGETEKIEYRRSTKKKTEQNASSSS